MLDRASPSQTRFACSNCNVVAPMVRLPIASLAPGELQSSEGWLATAAMIEATAALLVLRTRGDGRFSQAQAADTAGRLREAAAEIRANLALEEMVVCRTR